MVKIVLARTLGENFSGYKELDRECDIHESSSSLKIESKTEAKSAAEL
jgi:hypothetical protein